MREESNPPCGTTCPSDPANLPAGEELTAKWPAFGHRPAQPDWADPSPRLTDLTVLGDQVCHAAKLDLYRAVEFGYSPDDAARLTSEFWTARMSVAIRDGVEQGQMFFRPNEGTGGVS